MKTYFLKNGLKVVFLPREGKTLGISMIGRAGSLYAPPGVAHFTEHSLLCATEKYPDFISLANIVDSLGLHRNVYTSIGHMHFVFKCLPEHFGAVCEFLSEVVTRPLFLDSDIKKQRSIITQEIRKKLSDSVAYARLLALNQLYGDSRYGISVLGSEETISKITKEDIIAFFNERFVANNFLLVISGNIDQHAALFRLEETLGKMPISKVATVSLPDKSTALPSMKKVYGRQGIQQAVLSMLWDGYTVSDERRYAAFLFKLVMTEGRLSRLWQGLRQQSGLVYSVNCHISRGDTFGNISITTGLAYENVEAAIEKISAEILSIAERGVTDSELSRVKGAAKTLLAFQTDSTFGLAEYYSSNLISQNDFTDLESEIKRLDAVSKEEISQIARDLILRGAHITILKPTP